MSHASECTATRASQSLRCARQRNEYTVNQSMNQRRARVSHRVSHRVSRASETSIPTPRLPTRIDTLNGSASHRTIPSTRSLARSLPPSSLAINAIKFTSHIPRLPASFRPSRARPSLEMHPLHFPFACARFKRTCMPSRAKLIPSAGSGSSGGTSSAGNCTSHVPSGFPYRHKFSLSGSHCA